MLNYGKAHVGDQRWVSDLEELRRPILADLCIAAIAVSWMWWLVVFPEHEYPPRFPVLAPPILPSLAATAALLLRRAPLTWRSILLLLGVEVSFLLAYSWDGNPVWLYYQPLTVIVAGLLIGPGASFAFALLVTLASHVAVGMTYGGQPTSVTLPLAGLVWGVAATSWLSSRSLYTALNWSMQSQARAWKVAEEASRRREQLRATLDSLRHAHNALERTTRDLQAATLEAEDARRVKSRFVASISHEFRTPLNIIIGFAEMLATSPSSYGEARLPPDLVGDLLIIWRQAEHLLHMVDDVLDLAQIEASRFTLLPEPTDLVDLIKETLTDAGPLLQRSGLELRVSLPSSLPQLLLDRTRIRQVILNLLNNATRFTWEGYVEVGAFAGGREVVVYVKDSGRGIPEAKLEAIFEEFEQADASLRREGQGAGLGLAISRQFIRLHGGRIWAESSVGHGSTFYVALPVSRLQAAVQPLYARRSWPAAGSDAEEPRPVLVLTRDDLVGRTLQRHIEDKEVMLTHSFPEAVSTVRDYHPDIALVSCDGPGNLDDGMEQAWALLKAVAPFDLPILVCGFPTERRASGALGVSDFLIKPVTRQQVLEAIRRAASEPRRLLVVDDEADMLRLLTRIVSEEWSKAEVRTAASVEEASGLLTPRPDVVLLDLLMPGASGLELLQALQRDRNLAEVPVIVITARGPAEDLAAARHGEVRLLRHSSFTGGDLARIVSLITKALPPHYGLTAEAQPGTAAVEKDAPA